MFLSRLAFHTLPGKTEEVENKLMTLAQWVHEAGGTKPRIMRTHFSSLGAPDLLFEQEVEDPAALEQQIKTVTEKKEFQERKNFKNGRRRSPAYWNSRRNASSSRSSTRRQLVRGFTRSEVCFPAF